MCCSDARLNGWFRGSALISISLTAQLSRVVIVHGHWVVSEWSSDMTALLINTKQQSLTSEPYWNTKKRRRAQPIMNILYARSREVRGRDTLCVRNNRKFHGVIPRLRVTRVQYSIIITWADCTCSHTAICTCHCNLYYAEKGMAI